MVCAPLISRGKVLGVVEILNKSGNLPFEETDQDLLSVLALIAAIALDDLARAPEPDAESAPAASVPA
jgi:sigma-B regulation protein RsbU (phosphoserine phosphatase)